MTGDIAVRCYCGAEAVVMDRGRVYCRKCDPGTCPNCGDASRLPCINCYTYGAHGGPCHHHPALDERSIGRCNRNRCEVTA